MLAVILDSEPVYGWRDRTIGARARTANSLLWLRVLTAAPERAHGKIWEGTATAEAVQGVAKPSLVRAVEWDEDGVRVRAELTTFIADRPCSPTPELRQPLDLPDRWWRSLRASLDAVAATPTDRVTVRQDLVTRRVSALVGDRVDPTVRSWATAHGDLHWANLTQPACYLLDWEGWGLAPRRIRRRDAVRVHAASAQAGRSRLRHLPRPPRHTRRSPRPALRHRRTARQGKPRGPSRTRRPPPPRDRARRGSSAPLPRRSTATART